MPSYNRVILMGNLTHDPVLKYTASKTAVCNVGIAVNERRKKGDGWIDVVHFIDLTLWQCQAEIANEYLSKGSPIHIEGKLQQETWMQNDQQRSKLVVVVDQLKLLEKRPANEAENNTKESTGTLPEEVRF